MHSSAGAGLGWGRRSPPCRAASGDRRHGKCTRGSVITSRPQGENRVLAKQMGLDLRPSWGRDSVLGWGGWGDGQRARAPKAGEASRHGDTERHGNGAGGRWAVAAGLRGPQGQEGESWRLPQQEGTGCGGKGHP